MNTAFDIFLQTMENRSIETSDAEWLGIDMVELKREAFNTPSHYRLMRQHLKQVKDFEIDLLHHQYLEQLALTRITEFFDRVEAIGEEFDKPVEKNSARKKSDEDYEFTDRQLELARKALGLA